MRPIDCFLSLAGAEVAAAATGHARSAGSRVAALLAETSTPADTLPPQRLGVCRHLAAACAEMRPDLAAAFKALEPALAWRTRTMPNASPGFAEGHASARGTRSDRLGAARRARVGVQPGRAGDHLSGTQPSARGNLPCAIRWRVVAGRWRVAWLWSGGDRPQPTKHWTRDAGHNHTVARDLVPVAKLKASIT